MGCPMLQEIAMSCILNRVWKNFTDIHKVISTIAYNNKNRGEYSIENDSEYLDTLLKQKLKQVMNFKFLPYNLKLKCAVILEELVPNVKLFAMEFVEYSNGFTTTSMKQAIKLITFNQHCDIDTGSTILNIFAKTCFKVEFKLSFLNQWYVKKSDIMKLAEKALKNKGVTPKARMYIEKISNEYNEFDETLDNMRGRYGNDGLASFLMIGGYHKLRKHLLNSLDLPERQHCIMKSQQFNRLSKYIEEDNIYAYYVEHLNDADWLQVVKNNLEVIFSSFVHSWKHRHLCLSVFRVIKDNCTPQQFSSLFLETWEMRSYERHEIKPIILAIWSEAPQHLKENKDVKAHFQDFLNNIEEVK